MAPIASDDPILAAAGRRAHDVLGAVATPPSIASSAAPVAGTWSISVAVIKAWPPSSSIATSRERRSGSSSLITSSRSNSGSCRRAAAQRLALGEEQGEEAEPLLALRPVAAQRAAAERELELVAMGPVAGEAAGDVAGPPLDQLGDDRLGVALGVGPRPVGDLGAAGEAELRGGALRTGRRARAAASARAATSGTARSASAESQAESASGSPPRLIRASRLLRCASACA